MANIVIIGAGVSGLSAGIYAQMNGHSAIICEKHFRSGGNLTGWQRGDYHIDNCIHWLTGTNEKSSGYSTWRDLGALDDNTELYRGESLYTCTLDGESISLFRDIEKLRKRMLDISPADKKETERLIRAVKVAMDLSCGEGIKRYLSCPSLIRYVNMSTGELSKRFRHPLLKEFIVSIMGAEFGAIALVFVFATFCSGNGDLPRGGSVGMAERLTARFTSLGGVLNLKREAVKVELDGNRAKRVIFADGGSIEADYFILTPDPKVIFGKLLNVEMPKRLESLYDDKNMHRFSSIHAAFACDMEKPPFTGDYIFRIPTDKISEFGFDHIVIREFSHEPAFAPKGKSIIQAMIFCGEDKAMEYIRLYSDAEKYKAKKEEIGKNIRRMIEDELECMRGRLECIDVWTPATYKRYTSAEVGSYMSFILPRGKLPMRISSEVKGIKNLFLATQWQHSPGGLPTAAACGKSAIDRVLYLEAKKEKRVEGTGRLLVK